MHHASCPAATPLRDAIPPIRAIGAFRILSLQLGATALRRVLTGLLLFPALALAAPPWPDTPSGQVARAWVEVLNSGDRARIARFVEQHALPTAVDTMLAWREETGGVDLVRIERDTPTVIAFLQQQRLDPDQLERVEFAVAADDSGKIERFEYKPAKRPADMPIPRLSQAQALDALSARMDALARQDRFSGVMLVAKDGRVVFEQARGLADRARERKASARTRFRLGSMNKMFTAVAILQLVEQGRLGLDATLGQVLDGYPDPQLAQATVRQLLSHTAGAGDIFGPEWEASRTALQTHSDYLRVYGRRAPTHPPGSADAYANYGYVLLGAVIERVSGMSYYDYIDAHVFAPAGMKDSGSLPEASEVPRRAVGYLWRDGAWVDNADTLPVRGMAAGGGYSTARDLLRFVQALQSGRLLSPDSVAKATQGQNHGGWYGYGFIVTGEGPLRRFGHAGGASGMSTGLWVYPQLGIVTVALSNLDPPAADRLSNFFEHRMPIGAAAADLAAGR